MIYHCIILFSRCYQRTKPTWKRCSDVEKLEPSSARQNQLGRTSWKPRNTPRKTRRSCGSFGRWRNKIKRCTRSRGSYTKVCSGRDPNLNPRPKISPSSSGSGWCHWFVILPGCSRARMTRMVHVSLVDSDASATGDIPTWHGKTWWYIYRLWLRDNLPL